MTVRADDVVAADTIAIGPPFIPVVPTRAAFSGGPEVIRVHVDLELADRAALDFSAGSLRTERAVAALPIHLALCVAGEFRCAPPPPLRGALMDACPDFRDELAHCDEVSLQAGRVEVPKGRCRVSAIYAAQGNAIEVTPPALVLSERTFTPESPLPFERTSETYYEPFLE